ncbi:MAG: glycerol-3-phosphate acyltransferase [Candidatus Dormibacteraeota bacterium]|nr:glycerol-3-phosphate acyltransferase [Candidatus Dormibacteraeota bacterium]
MLLVSCFFFGYLVGSIPIGLIVGHLSAGLDIRRVGTGNIGASNTWRNVGLLPAAVVGVGSFVQGFLPAWLSGVIFGQQAAMVAAGVGAVAGYGWSFMLRFRGGSAVGTATGALAAIAPLGLVPLLALYALGAILRQPAPGVLLGLISFVGYVKFTAEPLVLLLGSSVIVFAVIMKRFDGFQDDLHSDHAAAAFFERLLFDRRPGRGLVGPIE